MPQIKIIHNQNILYIGDEKRINDPAPESSLVRLYKSSIEFLQRTLAKPQASSSNNTLKEKITPKLESESKKNTNTQKLKEESLKGLKVKRLNTRKDEIPIIKTNPSTAFSGTTSSGTGSSTSQQIKPQKVQTEKSLEKVGQSEGERSSSSEDSNSSSSDTGSIYGDGNTYGGGFYLPVDEDNDYTDINNSGKAAIIEAEKPELELGGISSNKVKPKKPIDFEKEIEKIKTKLKKKNPLLNIDNPLIYNKKPLFIKSYSVFDFLTPYIKCYIVIKDFDKDFSNKKNLVKTFFDIPYNMIESFSIEYETQSAINGKIRLVLNDTTGIIGNIFTSMLYTLGYNADLFNAVPKINIEFGYAKKGLRKLPKKEQKKVLYKNFFSEFLILNTEMTYDDKFKQQIVLTGHQEKTGISSVLNNQNSNYNPSKILGEYPTETLKLLVYHRLLKEKKINNEDIIKEVFGQKNLNTNNPEYQKLVKIIDDFKNCTRFKFTQEDPDLNDNLNESFKKNIFSTFLQPNTFFNSFDNANPANTDAIKRFKVAAGVHLKRQVFSPMLLFSFVLNIYINQIIKKEADLNSYILTLFNLKDVKWGIVTPGANTLEDLKTFTKLCELDHLSSNDGTKSKIDCTLNSNTFQIFPNTTWDNLLTNLIDKITLAKEKPPIRLYMNHSKFINSGSDSRTMEFEQQFDQKNFGYTAESRNKLLERIDLIIEKLKDNIRKKDNNTKVEKIEDLIVGLKEEREKIVNFINNPPTNKDFVFFVISPGTNFITPENYGNFFILQHYTVFPKIKTNREISYQNFSSGKNKLYDESFPDVISFQPKINFQNVISSHINHISDIELKNGILTVTDETLGMEFLKDSGITDDVKSLIKYLNQISSDVSTDSKIEIKTVTNRQGYFTIQGHPNIILSGTIISNLQSYISGTTGALNIKKEEKTKFDGNIYKNIIVRINNLKLEIERKIRRVGYGYHYNELNNIFKKSLNVLPGDNSTAEFYNYQNLSNRYNLDLSASATNFDAELKILGEPAFTFDFFPFSNILIRVNNFDGSRNDFLSGVYRIVKMRHEIDKGNFFTILSLQYTLESYAGHKGINE